MDRRRKLSAFFLIVLVIAALDIRANGIDFIDQWGRLFEYRVAGITPGDPSVFARGTAVQTVVHPANDVATLVLKQAHGAVVIHGEDTDVVSIEMTVHTLTDDPDEAQAYADEFCVTVEAVGDELRVGWQAPEGPADIRLAQMTWHITVPRDMGLAIEAGSGFVNVWRTAGPVQVESVNTSVQLNPEGAAPIHVNAFGGMVTVLLKDHVANYDVQAAARLGTIVYPLRLSRADDAFRVTREGFVTSVTGTLGDGEHPLNIHMTGGTVRLSFVQQQDD